MPRRVFSFVRGQPAADITCDATLPPDFRRFGRTETVPFTDPDDGDYFHRETVWFYNQGCAGPELQSSFRSRVIEPNRRDFHDVIPWQYFYGTGVFDLL